MHQSAAGPYHSSTGSMFVQEVQEVNVRLLFPLPRLCWPLSTATAAFPLHAGGGVWKHRGKVWRERPAVAVGINARGSFFFSIGFFWVWGSPEACLGAVRGTLTCAWRPSSWRQPSWRRASWQPSSWQRASWWQPSWRRASWWQPSWWPSSWRRASWWRPSW